MKRGFTLVEIAVALVIMGLLVGLIFKGYNMTIVARNKAEAAKIERIQIAVNGYYDRFGYLPGSSSRFPDPSIQSTTMENISKTMVYHGFSSNDDFIIKNHQRKVLAVFRFYTCYPGEVGWFTTNPSSVTTNRNLASVGRVCLTADDLNLDINAKTLPAWTPRVPMFLVTAFELYYDDAHTMTGLGREVASIPNYMNSGYNKTALLGNIAKDTMLNNYGMIIR